LRPLAGDECASLESDAKPVAEFFGVRQRAPHARARCLEDDAAFDAVGRCCGRHEADDMQP